ncbi:hypothetical protein JCM10908_004877 [Rhodotorula pacifica]|uniref:uncharacterized protein n=1 Tax=Rhodotorula pacifica TaxID=1495444 RepID=UPI00317E74C8
MLNIPGRKAPAIPRPLSKNPSSAAPKPSSTAAQPLPQPANRVKGLFDMMHTIRRAPAPAAKPSTIASPTPRPEPVRPLSDKPVQTNAALTAEVAAPRADACMEELLGATELETSWNDDFDFGGDGFQDEADAPSFMHTAPPALASTSKAAFDPSAARQGQFSYESSVSVTSPTSGGTLPVHQPLTPSTRADIEIILSHHDPADAQYSRKRKTNLDSFTASTSSLFGKTPPAIVAVPAPRAKPLPPPPPVPFSSFSPQQKEHTARKQVTKSPRVVQPPPSEVGNAAAVLPAGLGAFPAELSASDQRARAPSPSTSRTSEASPLTEDQARELSKRFQEQNRFLFQQAEQARQTVEERQEQAKDTLSALPPNVPWAYVTPPHPNHCGDNEALGNGKLALMTGRRYIIIAVIIRFSEWIVVWIEDDFTRTIIKRILCRLYLIAFSRAMALGYRADEIVVCTYIQCQSAMASVDNWAPMNDRIIPLEHQGVCYASSRHLFTHHLLVSPSGLGVDWKGWSGPFFDRLSPLKQEKQVPLKVPDAAQLDVLYQLKGSSTTRVWSRPVSSLEGLVKAIEERRVDEIEDQDDRFMAHELGETSLNRQAISRGMSHGLKAANNHQQTKTVGRNQSILRGPGNASLSYLNEFRKALRIPRKKSGGLGGVKTATSRKKQDGDVEEEPFACLICSKTFTKQLLLKRHTQTVHEGEECACPICKKKFKSSVGYLQHLRWNHPQDLPPEMRDSKSRKGKAVETRKKNIDKERDELNDSTDLSESSEGEDSSEVEDFEGEDSSEAEEASEGDEASEGEQLSEGDEASEGEQLSEGEQSSEVEQSSGSEQSSRAKLPNDAQDSAQRLPSTSLAQSRSDSDSKRPAKRRKLPIIPDDKDDVDYE